MTTDGWGQPRRGRHVYVVLRWVDHGRPTDLESLTATKAFETLDEANAEATRLNALNADKGARYFVRVARLQTASDIRAR